MRPRRRGARQPLRRRPLRCRAQDSAGVHAGTPPPGRQAQSVWRAAQVTRAVIEAAKGRLKVVGRAGVGVDNVDLGAATEARAARRLGQSRTAHQAPCDAATRPARTRPRPAEAPSAVTLTPCRTGHVRVVAGRSAGGACCEDARFHCSGSVATMPCVWDYKACMSAALLAEAARPMRHRPAAASRLIGMGPYP